MTPPCIPQLTDWPLPLVALLYMLKVSDWPLIKKTSPPISRQTLDQNPVGRSEWLPIEVDVPFVDSAGRINLVIVSHRRRHDIRQCKFMVAAIWGNVGHKCLICSGINDRIELYDQSLLNPVVELPWVWWRLRGVLTSM